MTRRVFKEEAKLVDRLFGQSERDAADQQPLEGLPPPACILFETGKAVAAALAFGLFLGALIQWTGLR